MPSRPFSATIIGGLWPDTDPDHWSDVGETMNAKARELEEDAATIRREVAALSEENSGQMIDAMGEMYLRDAIAVDDAGRYYWTMSEVVSETAGLIYHCRSRLDEIDRVANAEIQRIREQATGLTTALAMQEITQVIAQARADAMTESTAAAAEITRQASLVGTDPPTSAMGSRTGGSDSQEPPATPFDDEIIGDGGGTHATPAGGHGTENAPRQPPGEAPTPKAPERDRIENPQAGATPREPPQAVHGTDGTSPTPEDGRHENPQGLTRPPMPMPPPMAMPSTSGTSGGAPGLGAPPLSSPLGGAGSVPPLNSAGALNPAAGMVPPQTPAVPPPSVAGADFSRGLNAGLAAGSGSSGAPVLPPPVSAPPPAPAASTVGAPSAPVPPAPASAPVPANAGSMPAGAAMVPPAGGGPLPPFGSDVTPRQVGPATGSPPTPPPAAAGAGPNPPATPLPPGVVASGVGPAAGAAGGARVSTPDALLEAAVQLVYQLMHASRVYGCLDWCVGVFKTPHGVDTVVCSSEGAGYIPPGVFVPRSVRMLFADTGLGPHFVRRWFGWVNPAQTMLAYAALRGEHNPNVELYAVAVSTDHGGSSLPARDAGVRHYEDCALVTSPIPADATPMPLDETHVHRLQTIDPASYARLIAATVPESQLATEWWATTREAVQVALARAGALLGLEVPPVIRDVLAALEAGEAVGGEQWAELALARFNASLDAASQRPGRSADHEEASPYARAYHNLARAAELLAMWRGGPQHLEITYAAGQIMKEVQLWAPDAAA